MGGVVRAGGEGRRRGASPGHAVLSGSGRDGGRKRSCSVDTETPLLLGRAGLGMGDSCSHYSWLSPLWALTVAVLAPARCPGARGGGGALVPSLGRTRGWAPTPRAGYWVLARHCQAPTIPHTSSFPPPFSEHPPQGAAEVQLHGQRKPSAMDEPAQFLCTRTSTGQDFGDVRKEDPGTTRSSTIPGSAPRVLHCPSPWFWGEGGAGASRAHPDPCHAEHRGSTRC